MDITDTPDLGSTFRTDANVQFPDKPAYNTSLAPLLKELKQKNMYKNLEKFTSFHTRYYRSTYVQNLKQFLLTLSFGSDSRRIKGAILANVHLDSFRNREAVLI